ncbi:MAG: PAS domain S-box protein [Bacteroidales bacterium]
MKDALLKWMMGASGMGILLLDKDLNIMDVNEWVLLKTGKRRDEIITCPITRVFPEITELKNDRYLQAALKGEIHVLSGRFHKYFIRIPVEYPDGKVDYMLQSANVSPLYEGGEIVGVTVAIQDITERTLYETRISQQLKELKDKNYKLEQSEQQYKELIESTEAIAWEYDIEEDRWTYIAPQIEKIFGFSRHEAMEPGFWMSHIHPLDVEKIIALYKAFPDTVENLTLVYRFRDKQGKFRWVRDFVQVSLSRKKGMVRRGIMLDITASREAEEQIRYNEALFRTTLYSIGDGVITTNSLGNVRQMNPVAELLTGWKEEEATGKPLAEVFRIISEDSRLPVDDPVIKVLREGKVVGLANHTLLISRDGREIPISDSGAPIKNDDGDITGVVLVFHDQTEERAARRKLEESEARYRYMFYNNPQPMWIYDLDSLSFLEVNDAAVKHYGYSRDEFLRMTIKDIRPAEDIPLLLKDVEATKHQLNQAGRWRHLKKNGEVIDVEITSFAVEFAGRPARHVMVNDITERLKAEEALAESERRFRNLAENAPDLIFHYQILPERKFTYVSPSATQITGYTPEEHYADPDLGFKIVVDEDKQILASALNIQPGAGPVKLSLRWKRKDGHIIWTDLRMVPIFDESGQLVALEGISRDVTEVRLAQLLQEIQYNVAEALVKTTGLEELVATIKKELNKVIDTTNFYIAFYDENDDTFHSVIFIDQVDRVSKWPAKGSLSKYLLKINKAVFLKRKDIEQLAEDGEIEIIGHPAVHWLGVPLRMSGVTEGVMVVQSYSEDIPFSEQLLQVLEEIGIGVSLFIEQKKQMMVAQQLLIGIESSPVSTLITDREGYILYVNNAFYKTTGFTPSDIKRQTPRILKSGLHPADYYEKMWQTIVSGEPWKGQILNKRKDGSTFWATLVISPMKNKEGIITHFIAVMQDITEEIEMITALHEAKEKAEESDRLKSGFLANMSHEIRTPLNGIIGFAEMLATGHASPEEVTEFGQVILSSSTRLLELLNNIVDLSKIEAGAEEIVWSSVSPAGIIDEVLAQMNSLASKKHIGLRKKIAPEVEDLVIMSDVSKLHRILVNLVNNGIKFTDKGYVEVACSVESDNLVVKVIDSGRGIAPEHLPRIFERFYQTDYSYSRGWEGAGLGLAISKGLVEMLGGTIWVESKLGEGSVFAFTLPIKEAPKAKSESNIKAKDLIPTRQLKVMVAEDDISSYNYLKILLSRMGCEVLHAPDGLKAIELMQDHPDIDLVLMDIKMPGMDGFEAARQIRKINPKVVIIAQTAHAMAGDRERILSADFDDYLSKPIRSAVLIETIRKFFPK